jgi:ABC-type transport system involved in cytochrome c biogenesis permease subunit
MIFWILKILSSAVLGQIVLPLFTFYFFILAIFIMKSLKYTDSYMMTYVPICKLYEVLINLVFCYNLLQILLNKKKMTDLVGVLRTPPQTHVSLSSPELISTK